MSLTVAVTRPQPQADGTAARLRRAGYRVLLAPLLSIEPLGDGGPAAEFAALAFTSRTAPMLLAGRRDLHAMPVYAVGAATAREAERAGFREVVSADGDAAALAALIARQPRGPVLHLSGEAQRGELVGRLARAGIPAERRALYRMAEAAALPDEAADVALIYSPRTAALFRRLADGTPWRAAACAVLSPAVAEALGPWPAVRIARRSDEDAMLAALAGLASSGRAAPV